MTEDDARDWIGARATPARIAKVDRFVAMVEEERYRQNLISPASAEAIWVRHVVDSAQLMSLGAPGVWCDVGTGAGFPGMIVAILRDDHTVMVEPRAKRASFLQAAVDELGLNATVFQGKAERASVGNVDVISARAVATIGDLLTITTHFSTAKTKFILPRGRTGSEEVAKARADWHGLFHVEQSVTDPQSTIVTITGVSRRCSASR